MFLICNLAMGICVAVAAFFSAAAYRQFLDFVEADLADRLRSLRYTSRHLRRWIQIWLAIVVTVFFLLEVRLDRVACPVVVWAPAKNGAKRLDRFVIFGEVVFADDPELEVQRDQALDFFLRVDRATDGRLGSLRPVQRPDLPGRF